MAVLFRNVRSIYPRMLGTSTYSLAARNPVLLKRRNIQPFATSAKASSNTVTINFINLNGSKSSVMAKVGDTIHSVAVDNDISDLKCACGGTLSCSTCHVNFDPEEMSKLDLDEITDEEIEMLSIAYSGRTETSRLGCQVTVTEAFDGITLTIPESRDVRED